MPVDHRAIFARKKPVKAASDAPSGEAGTGFVKGGDGGPFQCGNCVHMRNGGCYHPKMMAESAQPKKHDGSVQVGESDCCEYQRRPGDK